MEWTPEQKDAIEATGQDLCVDAAAGSGKTRVLVERVVHLLDTKATSLDKIVAITFTRKAAAEMKSRLRAVCRLREEGADARAVDFWREAARHVETARIMTIDAFCTSLLHENALAVPLDPDFTVLPEPDDYLLRSEVVERKLHALFNVQDEAALRLASECRLDQLKATLEVLLSKGGVMAEIARDEAWASSEALLAAWPEKVEAARMAVLASLSSSAESARLRAMLAQFEGRCSDPSEGREVWRRQMLALFEEIGQCSDAKRINRLIEGFLADKPRRGKSAAWDSPEAFKRLADIQKEVKKFLESLRPQSVDTEIERAAAQMTWDFFAVYSEVLAEHRKAKEARAALDFGDLMLNTLELLRGNMQARERIGRTIEHLLVDEFQDTNSEQLELVSLLMDAARDAELFIVGDAKQSIYAFRGAEVEVFAQAQEGKRRIALERNFRSAPEVLAFVNEVFARTNLLSAVESTYHPMTAHREGGEACRVEFLIADKPADDASVEVGRAAEAGLIAGRIAEMCAGESRARVGAPKTNEVREAGFGDVALLFRAMSSVHLYEQALRRANIPYQVAAGAGFYERQEVMDLRNLLSLVVDPWNDVALLGFLRSPMVGLSDEGLVRLTDGEGLAARFWSEKSLAEPEQTEALGRARRLIHDLHAHCEMPLPAFVRLALDMTGYEAIVSSLFLGGQRACNVRKLIDLAHNFTRSQSPRLHTFLAYLEEMAAQEIREGEASLQPEGADVVTLMTIHKAKGLEFPIVFLPDCSREVRSGDSKPVVLHRALGMAARVTNTQGRSRTPALYDAIVSDHKDKELAEHARLMYVAMTRARDWLLLSGTPDAGKYSWFETLNGCLGLSGCADGAALQGDGWRAVVRRSAGPAHVPSVKRAPAELPLRESLLARIGPVDAPSALRRMLAVTRLVEAMAVDGASRSEGRGKPTAAARVGIAPHIWGDLVHLFLEEWDFRTPPEPLIENMLGKDGHSRKRRERLRTEIENVARRVACSDVGERVRRGEGFQREAPFLFRLDDVILNGVVDLLFDDGSVVDYKTGHFDALAHERHVRQIQLYAAAVRVLLEKEPPMARIYYVDEDVWREVDVSEAAVEKCLGHARAAIQALREL